MQQHFYIIFTFVLATFFTSKVDIKRLYVKNSDFAWITFFPSSLKIESLNLEEDNEEELLNWEQKQAPKERY